MNAYLQHDEPSHDDPRMINGHVEWNDNTPSHWVLLPNDHYPLSSLPEYIELTISDIQDEVSFSELDQQAIRDIMWHICQGDPTARSTMWIEIADNNFNTFHIRQGGRTWVLNQTAHLFTMVDCEYVI